MSAYQPKTGAKCSCRRGLERDNCPSCEGTGMVVDFAAIRRTAVCRRCSVNFSENYSAYCSQCEGKGD